MCLSLAIHRPDNVLAQGRHMGYQWMIIHNGKCQRCGYVRVPPGHQWHGCDIHDMELQDVHVHGGVTFAERDEPCDKGGADDAWWLGFDTTHAQDLPDYELPGSHHATRAVMGQFYRRFSELMPGSQIRTTEYVQAECLSLCEQAAQACTDSETSIAAEPGSM